MLYFSQQFTTKREFESFFIFIIVEMTSVINQVEKVFFGTILSEKNSFLENNERTWKKIVEYF